MAQQPKKTNALIKPKPAKLLAAKPDNTSVKKPNAMESKYTDSLKKEMIYNYKIAGEHEKEAKYRNIPGSQTQKENSKEYLSRGNKASKEYQSSKNKLPQNKK